MLQICVHEREPRRAPPRRRMTAISVSMGMAESWMNGDAIEASMIAIAHAEAELALRPLAMTVMSDAAM